MGDPLKDTSGPSLNILVKLMAVESLVFAPFIASCGNGNGFFFDFFGVSRVGFCRRGIGIVVTSVVHGVPC